MFSGSSLVYYDDADALSRLHYPSRPFSEISTSNHLGEQVHSDMCVYLIVCLSICLSVGILAT